MKTESINLIDKIQKFESLHSSFVMLGDRWILSFIQRSYDHEIERERCLKLVDLNGRCESAPCALLLSREVVRRLPGRDRHTARNSTWRALICAVKRSSPTAESAARIRAACSPSKTSDAGEKAQRAASKRMNRPTSVTLPMCAV